MLTGLSKNFINRLVTAVQNGAFEAPMDGRSCRALRDKPGERSVDAFFTFLYEFVAEPLAEGQLAGLGGSAEESDDHDDLAMKYNDDDSSERPVMDDFQQWVVGCQAVGAAQGPGPEQRWLNHCKLSDLYTQYKYSEGEPAGQALFYKVWRQKWRAHLRIRKASQHARCTDCTKYCQYRLKAKSEEEKTKINEAYTNHLRKMFADRSVAKRLISLSEASNRANTPIPEDQRIIYLQVDGMDQVIGPQK